MKLPEVTTVGARRLWKRRSAGWKLVAVVVVTVVVVTVAVVVAVVADVYWHRGASV